MGIQSDGQMGQPLPLKIKMSIEASVEEVHRFIIENNTMNVVLKLKYTGQEDEQQEKFVTLLVKDEEELLNLMQTICTDLMKKSSYQTLKIGKSVFDQFFEKQRLGA